MSPSAGSPVASNETPASTDDKQRGRWLLHEAWEQLHLGNYDQAQRKADEAEALNIKWGLFEDTPAKVSQEIKKARPKSVANKTQGQPVPHDRKTARVKLKEARGLLEKHEFEKAESIALEVKNWNLTYGIFEENPDKVAAAARALRRRDKIRNTPHRDQSSQGVYDILVQEARQLISVGKLDEAETKARQAQRMNVVPALTADRAEAVLHEVAMARAQKEPRPTPSQPGIEPPTLTLEREANELLAKGDQAGAQAKFAAADRIRTGEKPSPNVAGIAVTATADPAVRQSAATNAGPMPDLTAPTDNSAAPQLAPAPSAAVVAGPAAPANRGAGMVDEARKLFATGNYQAAKQMAIEAKNGKFGVDGPADELLAQIALTEQGGALSLYESALAAMRSGDMPRARLLLTEVAAAGDSLDESLRTKVENLLQKVADDKAKPDAKSGTNAAQDAEALAAQKLNAEVGTKIAEGRRLHETDPDKALALYERTTQAVQASGLPPELTRPMVRRLEVATEMAKKDKVDFERKMQDKQLRAEIEQKRLRILEADKAKKIRMKELMDKATTAYAEGNYVECESFAKRAMEIDPNELAASMLLYKTKMERRYKQDLENRNDKEEAVVQAFQGVDRAAIADPEVQLRDIKFPKSFKDLTRDRLAMNAKLAPARIPRCWRSRPSFENGSRSTWISSRSPRPSISCRITRVSISCPTPRRWVKKVSRCSRR